MNEVQLTLPGTGDYFMQESFHVLRTNLQFCGQDVKVIAVTSCGMNEGKSVLSLHLGRSLAEIGKKVLVIDADMRKSVIAGRNANLRNSRGLSEVLTGQETLQSCLCQTQIAKLWVLFAGTYPPNPVELLNSRHFDALLDSAKSSFDYIIVDTPPLGMVIDAAVIAGKCDSAVLVVGDPKVRAPQAQDVVSQLRRSGCNVLGVILNNAKGKGKGYYSKYDRYG